MVTGNSDPTQDEYVDLAQFARQLERELSAARRDGERMKWLRDNVCAYQYAENVAGNIERVTLYDLSDEAIDGAMEAHK